MKNLLTITLFSMALAVAGHVLAGDYGSREEAKAMAVKAAALIEEVGMEAARDQFHDKDGEFFDRDLYVFAYDREARLTAFGARQHMVGKVMFGFKDFEGRLIVQEFLAVEPGTSEWIRYKWQNAVSGRIDQKDTYIVGSDDYLVGVGYHSEAFYQASNE